MINEENLKNIRLFILDSGVEVIGYVTGRSLKSVKITDACKLITSYHLPDGQIRANPISGIFPFSSGLINETVTLKHRAIMSEVTPRPEVVEFWLGYVYDTDEEDSELVDTTETGLSLC